MNEDTQKLNGADTPPSRLMVEYFMVANSRSAPFFSDESNGYVMGESPEAALSQAVSNYSHPAGLYALRIYRSADSFHKGESHLAEHVCKKARMIRQGIPCPRNCGGRAIILVQNTGLNNDCDVYVCEECKAEARINHDAYREGGST